MDNVLVSYINSKDKLNKSEFVKELKKRAGPELSWRPSQDDAGLTDGRWMR